MDRLRLAIRSMLRQLTPPSVKWLKYQNDSAARERLANKVIQGGVGVWGHTPMPGQAQHTLEQTREMVTAILKSNQPSSYGAQGKDGILRLPPQPMTKEQATGQFIIQATYLDNGAPDTATLSGESPALVVKPKFSPQIISEGMLGYRDVEIRGQGPRVAPDTGAGIGYYNNPKATLHWMVGFPEPGEYEVFLTQAVPAPHDSSTYEISVANRKVQGIVVPTQGWTNYVEVKAGNLKVEKAGIQEVAFVPLVIKGVIVRMFNRSASSEIRRQVKSDKQSARKSARAVFIERTQPGQGAPSRPTNGSPIKPAVDWDRCPFNGRSDTPLFGEVS